MNPIFFSNPGEEVQKFPCPSAIYNHEKFRVLDYQTGKVKNYAIPCDAWAAKNGKVYICDLVRQNYVFIYNPDDEEANADPGRCVLQKPDGFSKAGAVMGIKDDSVIVVKDLKGLHFFSAETDEFLHSSEDLQEPYGPFPRPSFSVSSPPF